MFAPLAFGLKHRRKIALGLGALAVAGVVFAGYRFVSNLVDENASLAQRVGQMETAQAVQDKTIAAQAEALEEWEQQRADFAAQLQELSDGQQQAREETQRLLEVFGSSDFARLLDARPGLILDRVNAGTARIGRLLECASGATGPGCDDGADADALAPTIAETGTD